MAVITSAQITTIAIVGTTPHRTLQCPQPPPSHIIFIAIYARGEIDDDEYHRRTTLLREGS